MKNILLLIVILSGCATVDNGRDHYLLKTCEFHQCKILDIYSSLSYCLEMKEQLHFPAICEGFRER
jgi:hypothetical protein